MAAYDPSDPYRFCNRNCADESYSEHLDRIYGRILCLKQISTDGKATGNGLTEDGEAELSTLLSYVSDICECKYPGHRHRCRWCTMLRPEPEVSSDEADPDDEDEYRHEY